MENIKTIQQEIDENPDLFDIFAPEVKMFDKKGTGVIILPGSATESEHLVVETREDGGFTILDHVINKTKKASKVKSLKTDSTE